MDEGIDPEALKRLLLKQMAWLEARCRYRVERLQPQANRATIDSIADDLLQETLAGALVEMVDWFRQGPTTVGAEPRLRTLLNFHLARAVARWVRMHRESGDDDDSLDPVDPASQTVEGLLQKALDRPQVAAAVDEAVAGIPGPMRRLLFLAEYLPDRVTLELIRQAAQKGGRASLARPPEETFDKLKLRAETIDPDRSPRRWRASLVQITRFTGPLLPPPPDPKSMDWKRAANAVDAALSRARCDVAEALVAALPDYFRSEP